jgi:multimeric flavodoxin WrbA
MPQTEVLITFHSVCGNTEKLALAAAVGAVQARATIRFRRLPEVGTIDEYGLSTDCKRALSRMRKEYVPPTEVDVLRADAIIFAAPATFRSVSAEWTEHLDLIQDLRSTGKLEGKTAAAIQSDAGQDSLASVVLRLGFIMVPTGAHVDSVERALAHGRRLAEVTKMLKSGSQH